MKRKLKIISGTLLLLLLSAAAFCKEDSAQKPMFAAGASASGWIHFDFYDHKHIFIPAKINGHDTEILLGTGVPVPNIDKNFAASLGVGPEHAAANGDKDDMVRGLDIQIGKMTLAKVSATVADFARLSEHMGHALPFLIGDDAFEQLAVDIDFANHRIKFLDASTVVEPYGATEIPLTRVQDEHLVPLSIEGAPPAEFELGLGNSGEMLVYESYFKPHKLLDGRRSSRRFAAGTGGFLAETVATLKSVKFAGIELPEMPAAFIPATATAGVPSAISGDVGLPVLTRFRLILDYPHDRLYAVPYPGMTERPFPKDRLGMALDKHGNALAVTFVAPYSPAESAGFKAGDQIAMIDGKAAADWTESALTDLRDADAGTEVWITVEGAKARQVKLADYF